MMIPRHSLFVLLPCLAAVTLSGHARAQTPTLKDAYKGHFYVGVAINRSIVARETAAFGARSVELVAKDIALTKEQFNQISPENDLKWESIHPREGADGYNFAPADAFVEFGQKNKQYVVGHALVWHGQTPDWVFAGNVPPPAPPAPPLARGGSPDGNYSPGRRPRRSFGYAGPRGTREELLARTARGRRIRP